MKTAEGNITDIIEMQIGSKGISRYYNELKKHVPVLCPLSTFQHCVKKHRFICKELTNTRYAQSWALRLGVHNSQISAVHTRRC